MVFAAGASRQRKNEGHKTTTKKTTTGDETLVCSLGEMLLGARPDFLVAPWEHAVRTHRVVANIRMTPRLSKESWHGTAENEGL